MTSKQTRTAQLDNLATAHRLLVHQGIRNTFHDADFQLTAATLGTVKPLSDGEIEKGRVRADATLNRCRDFWTGELIASLEEDRGTTA